MINTFFYRLGLFLIFVTMLSCSGTKYLSFQTMVPAKIGVPAYYDTIALAVYADAGIPRFFAKNTADTIVLDSLLSLEFINGFKEGISGSPRFVVANAPLAYVFKNPSRRLLDPMDWNVLKEICDQSKAKAVISVEYFSYSDTLSVQIFYNQKTGYYEGSLVLVNRSLWRIYDPYEQSILDEYWLSDTSKWVGKGTFAFEVNEYIPLRDDALFTSALEAGGEYAERISQSWLAVSRHLNSKGHSDLRKGADLLIAGKSMEAIELFKKQAFSNKQNIAAAACYNLAVAYEYNDDLDNALEWAAKSYFTLKLNKTAEYISELEKRKKNKLIIINQLQ